MLDPVSTSFPVFDAYLNTLDAEVFIEVTMSRSLALFYRDRLYVMLSKLHHYRAVKKVNVYLSLVVVTLHYEEDPSKRIARLLGEFQPALSSGLLRVLDLRFTEPQTAEVIQDAST